MKRLSWPGVIVVAGTTILSWSNTSPAVSPVAHTPEAIESAKAVNRAAPTAASIAALRLHDWPPTIARRTAARDIFGFKRPAAQPAAPPAPSRGPLAAGDGAQPQLVPFKLIGFAEDAGPDGTVRTAIISGQGQLYLAKEGETIGLIYKVGQILPDSVELLDNSGGPSLRLAVK